MYLELLARTFALFLSFTRSVSAILSLSAFILAFPVKILSIIVLIRSRHSLLCGFQWFFHAMPALHNPDTLQCDRELRCQKTTRRTILAQPLEFFATQSWWSNSCFVRCPLQFRSHHLPRRATQAVPVRRVPWIAQCLSHPTCASHYSVLGTTQKTAPVLS